MTDDKLMTIEEVAEWLGVGPSWVYRRSRYGDLPTVMVGRYRRFRRSSVERWVSAQED